MKARRLMNSAFYVFFKAFDDAWDIIAPSITARPSAVEAARLRLANIVLGLAHNGSRDADEIRIAALRYMGF